MITFEILSWTVDIFIMTDPVFIMNGWDFHDDKSSFIMKGWGFHDGKSRFYYEQ